MARTRCLAFNFRPCHAVAAAARSSRFAPRRVYAGYNFFVGLLPFYMGFFGYDTTKETVNKYPALYAAGLRGMDLYNRRPFTPPP